jgi:signal transduction histidine kinase
MEGHALVRQHGNKNVVDKPDIHLPGLRAIPLMAMDDITFFSVSSVFHRTYGSSGFQDNSHKGILGADIDMISVYQERFDVLKRFLILVILLVFIILFLLYRKLRYISRINQQLEQKQEEVIQANKKLQEINAMRDKLFSIISHDLRNPFASIASFSRIIKRDIHELNTDELQELAIELDRSVSNINTLLDNLLHWSMAQTGKLSYNPEYIMLTKLVDENIDLVLATAKGKGIEISNTIDKDVVVWSDVNMTNSIIRNLLSNAIKYVNSGGSITLSSERVDDMIHVFVADTGVGIGDEGKSKILKPDYLLSTYGTNDEKGSGLGLLICKEFTEKQGGKIWFTSEPDIGSTFFFSLPAEKKIKKKL